MAAEARQVEVGWAGGQHTGNSVLDQGDSYIR